METFSVILAQLVGLNLGMEYDDGKECKCPGSICVMNTKAVYSNGIKRFSSCSIEDVQNAIKFKGAPCLSNRPNLKFYSNRKVGSHTPICGNGVLELGEKCDCGSSENCRDSRCCTNTCTFKRGAVCSDELCCENCKIKARNTVCRPAKDNICDFSEYCNGSSASCPADVYVQNGLTCASDTGFCYKGSCQSPELHCQNLFGKRSRNAPQACYEQINSQTDRFGHCGVDSQKAFKHCSKVNIRCGKLICVYPYTVPFMKLSVPVLYAPMNDILCISLDFQQPKGYPDSMLVKDGTKCGKDKVCINQVCEPASILKFDCDPEKKCSGHGICNSMKNCHCDPGWAPPDCKTKGSVLGGSVDSGLRFLESVLFRGLCGSTRMGLLCICIWIHRGPRRRTITDTADRAAEDRMRNWVLLSIFLFLPVAVIASLLVLKWKRINKFCTEDVGPEDDSESYSGSEELSRSEKTSISSNAKKM